MAWNWDDTAENNMYVLTYYVYIMQVINPMIHIIVTDVY